MALGQLELGDVRSAEGRVGEVAMHLLVLQRTTATRASDAQTAQQAPPHKLLRQAVHALKNAGKSNWWVRK